jgi:riboflavin synthase
MFTGIIETTGIVREVFVVEKNRTFWIEAGISADLAVDQSVSHNGVCLTVEEIKEGGHRVTAIDETLNKTNLEDWKVGDLINLERSLRMNDRLDGHFVQGHVDGVAICEKKKEKNGSWELELSFSKEFAELVIEKGSICLNGISLTAFDVKKKSFRVAIIPYTWNETNIRFVEEGDRLNIEFDLMGKYILRRLSLKE